MAISSKDKSTIEKSIKLAAKATSNISSLMKDPDKNEAAIKANLVVLISMADDLKAPFKNLKESDEGSSGESLGERMKHFLSGNTITE